MSNSNHILVAFASWEDRFVAGLTADLEAFPCSEVLVFFFDNYAHRTVAARSSVRALCDKRGVGYSEFELSPDTPTNNLQEMHSIISKIDMETPIVVDISTMPREIIWHIFWLCEGQSAPLKYRYHSPKSYSREWLSRNFGRPRFVPKLSGIALSGRPTALVLAVGYDVQRVRQMVRFFEPSRLMIGLQEDSQFDDNATIMAQYENEFKVIDGCSVFGMDAFAKDHGLDCILQQLQGLEEEHNIVLGSLGPKLSAVSLYCVQRKKPEMGLAYAPAREFNDHYSKGIGQFFEGTISTG